MIKGPGEESLYRLIKKINDNKTIKNIPGLVKSKECKLNETGRYVFQKPDFKGLPLDLYRWKLPKRLRKSVGFEEKSILILPFQFIMGCLTIAYSVHIQRTSR